MGSVDLPNTDNFVSKNVLCMFGKMSFIQKENNSGTCACVLISKMSTLNSPFVELKRMSAKNIPVVISCYS